jgi:hypothetical protein
MKRLHVSVKDLAASIRFYQTLFGAEPGEDMITVLRWFRSKLQRLHAAFQRGGLSLWRAAVRNDREQDLQRPLPMHRQLGAQHLG